MIVSKFKYYSKSGLCQVEGCSKGLAFWVYTIEGEEKKFLTGFNTQQKAESFAKWMALGL